MRAVAAEAEIDPTMVIRYFGSKEDLFAAAVPADLQLPDFTHEPPEQRGHAVVRHFLRRWEGELSDDVLGVLLRSATTHPAAAERLRGVFAHQVLPAVTAVAPDSPQQRASLMASQLLGLALCRYVLRLPPIDSADAETLTRLIGPTMQHYLVGELDFGP